MLTVADIGEGVSKITEKVLTYFMDGMAIWVVEFSNGGYKIRKVFA